MNLELVKLLVGVVNCSYVEEIIARGHTVGGCASVYVLFSVYVFLKWKHFTSF